VTIDTTNRLPRYRRASTEVACVLTTRDLEILKHVESFRLLTSEHIRLLVPGSDQNILRRLQILFHPGYLDRPRPHRVENGGSSKMVYAITNKGVQKLQKEGLIQTRAKTDRNAQNKEVGDLYLAHTLLVSQIRAMFLLACQAEPQMQFLFWREGRELLDTIEVTLPDRYAEFPVAPDGFFGLRDAKGRLYFFVEADRGTSTLKRFTRKLLAYAAYSRTEKHKEKFGIQKFRVLTVTSSRARCRNLVQAAAAAEDLREAAGIFLFTTEEKLALSRPETIFEKIWLRLGIEEPCSLGLVRKSQMEGEGTMQQNPNAQTEVRHGP
jgi:protein involved in plasmid replication-relaxation